MSRVLAPLCVAKRAGLAASCSALAAENTAGSPRTACDKLELGSHSLENPAPTGLPVGTSIHIASQVVIPPRWGGVSSVIRDHTFCFGSSVNACAFCLNHTPPAGASQDMHQTVAINWNTRTLSVTSRELVWNFLEPLGFEFVPVLHGLQGRPAVEHGLGYRSSTVNHVSH
jgi:hypothetical protein